MPTILIIVTNKRCSIWIYCHSCPHLHKTCSAQNYNIGKTVQTVLLSEILFILFTFHFFANWRKLIAESAKCRWDYTT